MISIHAAERPRLPPVDARTADAAGAAVLLLAHLAGHVLAKVRVALGLGGACRPARPHTLQPAAAHGIKVCATVRRRLLPCLGRLL